MAAMGLFDVQGHSAQQPTFQFGSPLFDRITIQLDPKYYSGKTLVIETQQQSKENQYVQGVQWNGKPVNECWINRERLMQGGVLQFTMGNAPNKQWGIGTPPPSMSNNNP
jgi:putative alpha-1,2-mannosidase